MRNVSIASSGFLFVGESVLIPLRLASDAVMSLVDVRTSSTTASFFYIGMAASAANSSTEPPRDRADDSSFAVVMRQCDFSGDLYVYQSSNSAPMKGFRLAHVSIRSSLFIGMSGANPFRLTSTADGVLDMHNVTTHVTSTTSPSSVWMTLATTGSTTAPTNSPYDPSAFASIIMSDCIFRRNLVVTQLGSSAPLRGFVMRNVSVLGGIYGLTLQLPNTKQAGAQYSFERVSVVSGSTLYPFTLTLGEVEDSCVAFRGVSASEIKVTGTVGKVYSAVTLIQNVSRSPVISIFAADLSNDARALDSASSPRRQALWVVGGSSSSPNGLMVRRNASTLPEFLGEYAGMCGITPETPSQTLIKTMTVSKYFSASLLVDGTASRNSTVSLLSSGSLSKSRDPPSTVTQEPTQTVLYLVPIPSPERLGDARDFVLGVVGVVSSALVALPVARGGRMSIANAVSRMSACGDDDDDEESEVSPLVHPLRFSLWEGRRGGSNNNHQTEQNSSSGSGAYNGDGDDDDPGGDDDDVDLSGQYAAAVLSNTIIIPLGTFGAALLVARFWEWWAKVDADTAWSVVGPQSVIAVPLGTLGEGIGVSITLMLQRTDDALSVLIGIIGVVATAVMLGWWLWALWSRIPRGGITVSTDECPPTASSLLLHCIRHPLSSLGEWVPSAASADDGTASAVSTCHSQHSSSSCVDVPTDDSLSVSGIGLRHPSTNIIAATTTRSKIGNSLPSGVSPPAPAAVAEAAGASSTAAVAAPVVEVCPRTADVTEHTIEQYANFLGDKRYYYVEFCSLCCALLVGVAEGIPTAEGGGEGEGGAGCQGRAVVGLLLLVVQCGLAVTTMGVLDLFLQVVLSLLTIPMAVLVTLSVFVEPDGIRNDVVSALLIVSNVIGLLMIFIQFGVSGYEIIEAVCARRRRRVLERKKERRRIEDGEADDDLSVELLRRFDEDQQADATAAEAGLGNSMGTSLSLSLSFASSLLLSDHISPTRQATPPPPSPPPAIASSAPSIPPKEGDAARESAPPPQQQQQQWSSARLDSRRLAVIDSPQSEWTAARLEAMLDAAEAAAIRARLRCE